MAPMFCTNMICQSVPDTACTSTKAEASPDSSLLRSVVSVAEAGPITGKVQLPEMS